MSVHKTIASKQDIIEMKPKVPAHRKLQPKPTKIPVKTPSLSDMRQQINAMEQEIIKMGQVPVTYPKMKTKVACKIVRKASTEVDIMENPAKRVKLEVDFAERPLPSLNCYFTSSLSVCSYDSGSVNSLSSIHDVFKVKAEPVYVPSVKKSPSIKSQILSDPVSLSMLKQLKIQTQISVQMKKKNEELVFQLLTAQQKTNELLKKLIDTVPSNELSNIMLNPKFTSLLKIVLPDLNKTQQL